MHALHCCVGPEDYNESAHRGWCKIFSIMLGFMIPAVVHYELTHRIEALQGLAKRSVMARKSITLDNPSESQSLRASLDEATAQFRGNMSDRGLGLGSISTDSNTMRS